jgi:hypothetical protein
MKTKGNQNVKVNGQLLDKKDFLEISNLFSQH